MSAEFWSIVGAAIGLATLFVGYSQFILNRIDSLNHRIDKISEGLADIKQAVGELKGRVDELSGVVRAMLPPRAA